MLIGTWIPTHIFQEKDKCFASLLWFVSRYGMFGLILLSTLVGLLIASASVILIRLSKTTLVERNQRIAASRMVYYLVVGVVSSVSASQESKFCIANDSKGFVIPYFVSQTIHYHSFKPSMIANVVLNLSGLMNGLLQLFLRSNTASASFGPRDRSWPSNKHEIRIWGPNELAFNNQIMDPVSPLISPRSGVARRDSQKSLICSADKCDVINMSGPPIRQQFTYAPTKQNHMRSNEISPISSILNPRTSMDHMPSENIRKQSYSLFPAPAPESPNALLPPSMNRYALESVYDISDLSDLAPPPRLHGRMGHRRRSSVASSATVQIGIRFSQAPPPAASDTLPLSLPSTTYKAAELSATNSQAPALPSTTYTPTSRFNVAQNSTPGRIRLPPIQTTNLNKNPIPIPPRSPFRPSPPTTTNTAFQRQDSPTQSDSPRSSFLQKSPSVHKTLPATPKPATLKQPLIERLEQSDAIIQLNPTVYSPPGGSSQRKGSIRTIPTRSDSDRRH